MTAPRWTSTVLLVALVSAASWASKAQSTLAQSPPPDVHALARAVRDSIRREYSNRRNFTYLENRRDVKISGLGKVTIGPMRTFEVYPSGERGDTYKRLIAIEGKPLDAAELAQRDADHERELRERAERERTESPRQRAARLKREAEESQEFDDIINDGYAVFEPSFAGRETIDGEALVVVELKPKPHAPVKTREGRWMRQFAGRMWVSEPGSQVARLELHATDIVSIGWGVVARIQPGSGFVFARRKIHDAWLPTELTVQANGRTLLFREFQFKTITTYTQHRRHQRSDGNAR
jgi:hypothetical protein